MVLPPPGRQMWGQICKKKAKFSKIFSTPTHVREKNWLHGCMKPFTKIVKFMAPLLPHMRKKTGRIVMMSMKPFTKIVKFMAPGSGVQAQGWGQLGHMVKCIKS